MGAHESMEHAEHAEHASGSNKNIALLIAVIALFLLSGAAARFPMSSLPGRASRDMRTLVRTPAALVSIETKK